jgi:hypothetical protein
LRLKIGPVLEVINHVAPVKSDREMAKFTNGRCLMNKLIFLMLIASFGFANPFADMSKKLEKMGNSIKEDAEKAKDVKETADDIVKAHKEFKEEKKERQEREPTTEKPNEKIDKAKDVLSVGKKSYDVGSKAKARLDNRKRAEKNKK